MTSDVVDNICRVAAQSTFFVSFFDDVKKNICVKKNKIYETYLTKKTNASGISEKFKIVAFDI